MAREKIKIRRIDNPAARQVTFTKRRRGLFKKAQELAILCDVDVALIVFSAAGKLFEYASSSMCEILLKHATQFNSSSNPDYSFIFSIAENTGWSRLSKEFTEEYRQLRRMRGEELEELTLEELKHLERTLDVGLRRVSERKEQQIMEHFNSLQQKGMQLLETNKKLTEKLEEMCMAEKQAVADHPEDASNEDITHSSESVALDCDGIAATSLKLWPPGFNCK